MACKILSVKDNQGNESTLYNDLLAYTGDQQRAYLSYIKSQSKDFLDFIGDKEFDYTDVVEFMENNYPNLIYPASKAVASIKPKVTIEQQRQWYIDKFGNDSDLEIVQGLIAGDALGTVMENGQIMLSDKAEDGTLFHESFEKVFYLYLSETEQQTLRDELRNSNYKDTPLYKSLKEVYPNDADLEIEYLAERFRDYVLDQGSEDNIPIRSIFRRLLNFIKNIITPNTIEDVYKNIQSGYYRNKLPQRLSKPQTFRKKGITDNGFSPQEAQFILEGFNYYFMDSLFNITDPESLLSNQSKASDVYQDAWEEFTLYAVNPKMDSSSNEEAEKYKALKRNFKGLREAHAEYLKQYGIEVKSDDVNFRVDENGSFYEKEDDTKEDSLQRQIKDSFKFSTKDNMPKAVKMLLANIPVIDSVDKDGTPIYDFNPLLTTTPRTVPFQELYSFLAKNLAGVPDWAIFDELKKLESIRPEVSEIMNRMYMDTNSPGFSVDPEYGTDPLDFKVQSEFVQTFSKTDMTFMKQIIANDGRIEFLNLNDDELRKRYKNDILNILEQGKLGDADLYNMRPDEFFELIGLDDIVKLKGNAKSKAIKAFSYLQTLPVRSEKEESLTSVIKNNGDQKGNINTIVDTALENSKTTQELMLINAEGEKIYSITMNNYLSLVTDELNYIISNTSNKDEREALIEKHLSHLLNYNTRNSKWLQAAINNKKLINLAIIDGVAQENKPGSANKDIDAPDKHAQNINAVLKGLINNTFSVPFMRASDRGVENMFTLDRSLFIKDTARFNEVMRGYLVDELRATYELLNNNVGANIWNYREKAKDLRIFKDILSKESYTYLMDAISKPVEGDVNAYLTKIVKDTEELDGDFNSFVETKVAELKAELNDFGLLNQGEEIEVGNNKPALPLLFDEGVFKSKYNDIKSNLGVGFKPSIVVDSLLKDYFHNYYAGMIEQTKLYTGDLANFKSITDISKRTSALNGTKLKMFTSDGFNQVMKDTYTPRLDGKSFDNTREAVMVVQDVEVETSKQVKDSIVAGLKKIGMSDKQIESTLKGYKKANEADAQALSTLDASREMYIRSGKWTPNHEQIYKEETELLKLLFRKLNGENVDKEIKAWRPTEFSKGEVSNIMTLKTQYYGPMYTEKEEFKSLLPPGKRKFYKRSYSAPSYNKLYTPSMHKHSIGTMMPSTLYRVDSEGNVILRDRALTAYQQATNNTVGMIEFESAAKVGIKVDENGAMQPLYNSDGTVAAWNTNLIQELEYKYFGIQLEINPKRKESKTYGTQQRKLNFANLFESGEIQIEGLSKVFKDHLEVQKELILRPYKEVMDEIGLVANDKGEIIYTGKSDAFIDRLLDAATTRGVADNIIESINSLKTVEIGNENLLDNTPVKEKIENILFSMINSASIKQKVNGASMPQEASTLFEWEGRDISTANTDLGFYRTIKDVNGNDMVRPMEVEIVLPESYRQYVESLETKDVRGIDVLNNKIEALLIKLDDTGWSRKKLSPEESILLSMIEVQGYRIPTQDLSSIEAMVIKRFMPTSSGEKVRLPSEVVAKSGGDYDIDKLNIQIPNVSYTEEGQPIVKFDKSNEGLQNQLLVQKREIILHPDNFGYLVLPVDDAKFNDRETGLVKEIRDLRKQNKKLKGSTKQVTLSSLIDPVEQVKLFQNFLAGKAGVGQAAVHITSHAIALQLMDHQLYTNPEAYPFRNNEETDEEFLSRSVTPTAPKKEGVTDLFKDNPELANIGTEEEYSKYLDSIFPDSKVKDIVYHGSESSVIEEFDESKFLTGEGAMAFGQGFYFSENKASANYHHDFIERSSLSFSSLDDGEQILAKEELQKRIKGHDPSFKGKIYKVILDIKNPVSWERVNEVKRNELKKGVYKENDSVIHEAKGYTKTVGNIEKFEELSFELEENERVLNEGNFGAPDDLVTPEIREKLLKRNSIIKKELEEFNEYIQGETHYIVPKSNQAHILGSKKDIQGFKDFVSKPTQQSGDVKEGVSEVFNENPKLSEIGTEEQYSEYLDSVFPDSKVKDVVYHGSGQKFDEFEEFKIGTGTTSVEDSRMGKGFYFSKNVEEALEWATDFSAQYEGITVQDLKDEGRLKTVLLNILDLADVQGDEIVARKKEQIHILGSNKDVKGFEEWKGKNTSLPEDPPGIGIPFNRRKTQNGELISDIMSQILTGYVDIAKDPWIFDLNAGRQVANVIFMMLRMGTPVDDIFYFVNQPEIVDYVKAQALNEASILESKDKKTRKVLKSNVELQLIAMGIKPSKGSADPFDSSKQLKKAELNNITYRTKTAIGAYKYWKNLPSDTESQKAKKEEARLVFEGLKPTMQYDKTTLAEGIKGNPVPKVMDSFLLMQEYSKMFQAYVRANSPDTSTLGKNINELQKWEQDANQVMKDKYVVGLNRVLNDTIMSSFTEVMETTLDGMTKANLYLMHSNPILSDLFPRVQKEIAELGSGNNLQSRDAVSNEFVSFILQTYGNTEENPVYDERLITSTNLVDKLDEMKQKYPYNELLKSLGALRNYDQSGLNFIKLYRISRDIANQNAITEGWEELFNSEDYKFAHDLMKLSVMQTGITSTPHSFSDFIPFNRYVDYTRPILKTAMETMSELDGDGIKEAVSNFRQMFLLNRSNIKYVKKMNYLKVNEPITPDNPLYGAEMVAKWKAHEEGSQMMRDEKGQYIYYAIDPQGDEDGNQTATFPRMIKTDEIRGSRYHKNYAPRANVDSKISPETAAQAVDNSKNIDPDCG